MIVVRALLESIEYEYARYKRLGEGAIAQLRDEALSASGPNGASSVAIIVWHISGNLVSRFTDFLTADGEKPWRQREEEFDERTVTRAELLDTWEAGWRVLVEALGGMTDADLGRTVTIRDEPLAVHAALHRSLAHTSHHVGQIVYLAKVLRGADWTSLSIPRAPRS